MNPGVAGGLDAGTMARGVRPQGSTDPRPSTGVRTAGRARGWRRRLLVPDVPLAALLVLGSVASLVRMRPLYDRPFWLDEVWRAYRLAFPLRDLVHQRNLTRAPMPLGWWVLEHVFARIGGDVETVLRLPELLSLPALALCGYALCRQFLPEVTSFITAALIVIGPQMLNFSVELKPYTLDAAATAALFLCWLLGERSHTRTGRLWAALGVGACVLLSVPVLFFVPPLYAWTALASLSVYRRERARCVIGLVAAALAGGIAAVHYLWWLRPQSAVIDFWAADYPPPGLRPATKFFINKTVGWVPNVFVANPEEHNWLAHQFPAMTAICTGLLVLGLWASVRVARYRPVGFLLVSLWLIQIVAAAMHRWPFGYDRFALFVGPLIYLTVAVGAQYLYSLVRRVLRWARLPRSPSSLLAAAVVGSLVGVAASPAIEAGATYLNWVQDRTAGIAYGAGLRTLEAATLPRISRTSVAIITHPYATEAWLYYMLDYQGYVPTVQHSLRIPVDRTLIFPPTVARVKGMLRKVRYADKVFIYVFFGSPAYALATADRVLVSQGYVRVWGTRQKVTGAVLEYDLHH